MLHHRLLSPVVLALVALSGCARTSTPAPGAAPSGPPTLGARMIVDDKGPLTLYSGQHEQTVQALTRDFESRTGAKVNVRSAHEGDLANQLVQEGSASPADVFFVENPPALTALSQKKLLAPIDPATLGVIPPADSSGSGDWVGVTARTAALAYNTKAVAGSQLPASVLDLAKPEWRNKLALAPSEADFHPMVTAVIKLRGLDAARQWLRGLKSNAKFYDDSEAVAAAVNRGEKAAGILDHYYWFRFRSENKDKVSSALHYFAAGDPGAMIDISCAAVLASSKHPVLAQAFAAYLVSEPAQQLIAQSQSWEYPLRPGVTANPDLHALSSLTPAPLTSAELGAGGQALDLLQQVGLL